MRNTKTSLPGIASMIGGVIFLGVGIYLYSIGKDGAMHLTIGGGFITTGLGLLGAKDGGK